MSPVVGVCRDELAAVGTVPQIAGDPTATKFEEELFKPIDRRRLAYDVVEMFILLCEAQEAFARERKTAAVEHV